MNDIKVLHIAEAAYGGGAESVFRETVKLLQAHGGKYVHKVACKPGEHSGITADLPFVGTAGKSKWKEYLESIYSRSNYRALKAYLLKEQPQIIHIQNYGNLSPAVLHAVHYYKKRYPVRVIHTVHTYEYVCSHYAAYDYRKDQRCLDCQLQKYKRRIFYRGCSRKGWVHSWGKGLAALVADYFYAKGLIDNWITPSRFLQQVMIERIGKPEAVYMVRNPAAKAARAINKPCHPEKSRKNEVVYFGRLSEEKNVELLIEAFIQLQQKGSVPGVQLKIIGDGDQKEYLKTAAGTLNGHQIEFIPFLPAAGLQETIKEAKVAVLPSKCFETASLFVVEAVLAEIVPVVANHGAMAEMISYLACGRAFKSEDAGDLALQMEQALLNYGTYVAALNNAAGRIAAEMQGRQYADSLIEIYNKLIFSH